MNCRCYLRKHPDFIAYITVPVQNKCHGIYFSLAGDLATCICTLPHSAAEYGQCFTITKVN